MMSGVPHIEIHERAGELKDLMHQQRQIDYRERIKALYLLKSGQCQQVQRYLDGIAAPSIAVGLLLHWRNQLLA